MSVDPQAAVTPAIRSARPDEAAMLSSLAVRSKGHWGYTPEFLEACVPALTFDGAFVERADVFVAEVDGEVAGFGSLDQLDKKRAELMHLFVEPCWIGKGVGRALIEAATERARAAGIEEIIIQGDPNATSFYEAAGAKLMGSRPSEVDPARKLPVFTLRVALMTIVAAVLAWGCSRSPLLAHGPIELTEAPQVVKFGAAVAAAAERFDLCFEFDTPDQSRSAGSITATLLGASGERYPLTALESDRRGDRDVCLRGTPVAAAGAAGGAVVFTAVELSSPAPLHIRGLRGEPIP